MAKSAIGFCSNVLVCLVIKRLPQNWENSKVLREFVITMVLLAFFLSNC